MSRSHIPPMPASLGTVDGGQKIHVSPATTEILAWICRPAPAKPTAPKRKHPVAIPMRNRHREPAEAPRRTCSADLDAFRTGAVDGAPAHRDCVTQDLDAFGPVQEIDTEEHERRGDAAEALFRQAMRRATSNGGT